MNTTIRIIKRIIYCLMFMITFLIHTSNATLTIQMLTVNLNNQPLLPVNFSTIFQSPQNFPNPQSIILISILNWSLNSTSKESLSPEKLEEYDRVYKLIKGFTLKEFQKNDYLHVLVFASDTISELVQIDKVITRKELASPKDLQKNPSITLSMTFNGYLFLQFTLLNLSVNPKWRGQTVDKTSKMFERINSGFMPKEPQPHFLFVSGYLKSITFCVPNDEMKEFSEEASISNGKAVSIVNISSRIKAKNQELFEMELKKFFKKTTLQHGENVWPLYFLHFIKFDLFTTDKVKGFDPRYYVEGFSLSPPDYPENFDFSIPFKDLEYIPRYLYRTFVRPIVGGDHYYDLLRITDYRTVVYTTMEIDENNNGELTNENYSPMTVSTFSSQIKLEEFRQGTEVYELIKNMGMMILIIEIEDWVRKSLERLLFHFPAYLKYVIESGKQEYCVEDTIHEKKELGNNLRRINMEINSLLLLDNFNVDSSIFCLKFSILESAFSRGKGSGLYSGQACFFLRVSDFVRDNESDEIEIRKSISIFEDETMRRIGEIIISN